jgi:CheY-like chemotaxis protein
MNASGSAMTVLVADDDEDDRRFIRKAWAKERAPAALMFVENGEELIDYLSHAGKYRDPASSPRPSIILLDLNMPRKDGRQSLKEIKANPGLRQIPVIIFTTSQADEDIDDSYLLGANSFISKPRTFTALVDIMQTIGSYWIDLVDLGPANMGDIPGAMLTTP